MDSVTDAKLQILDEEIQTLKNHVSNLVKERDADIEKIIGKCDAECDPIYTRIAVAMKKMEDIVVPILSKPETLEFDNWETITEKDLKTLTQNQLEFLVWKRTGRKDSTRYGVFEGGFIYERTLEERKAAALIYLSNNETNCRYCHSVSHEKEKCPKLANKVCGLCKMQGHTSKRCKRKI